MTAPPLRVGYVPEHFSTPIYFAKKHYGLDAELIPFPSGTGHMITALRAGEIDVGIGLTEGWVAGLGKPDGNAAGDGGYRLVGTFVETPLCWAISTGAERPEITSVDSLQGGKIGVSRIGSGSYVMGYVLADQQGWLTTGGGGGGASSESPSSSASASIAPRQTQSSSSATSPYSQTVVLNTFEQLRKGVNSGQADFFMWEHFTSKRYYDAGEIRRVGEIYTPWSSWKIVASTAHIQQPDESGPAGRKSRLDERVGVLFQKLDQGIRHFNENQEEAVAYISTELDYSEADARAWLKTVQFPASTEGVDVGVVEKTVAVLRKAGVLVEGKGMEPVAMVAKER